MKLRYARPTAHIVQLPVRNLFQTSDTPTQETILFNEKKATKGPLSNRRGLGTTTHGVKNKFSTQGRFFVLSYFTLFFMTRILHTLRLTALCLTAALLSSVSVYADETVSAFDLSAPVIEVRDDDYGIFYVEAMDLPQRFDGKTVRFKAQMCKSQQFPEGCVPGRFAMVCCANDITFLGMACKAQDIGNFQNRDWVTITAKVKAEHLPAYGEEPGPVLYAERIEPADPAKEEVIQF